MARGKIKTAAPEEVLGELHLLTAVTLRQQIELYTQNVDELGQPKPLPVPPALLAQVNNFLKNNGIQALEPGEEGLSQLKSAAGRASNILQFPYKPPEACEG